MARLATRKGRALSPALIEEIARRRQPLARHMARAVVILVRWDDDAGAPPRQDAIVRACDAGLGLFLATARDGRPATPRELREVAQLGILQARGAQSVEPVLNAYRIAARVAWDAIQDAWRGHPDASSDAIMVTANYVFSALDQVAAHITRTYLQAREQHLLRGTRARTRLFHSLISDTFDSELEVRKQALALNVTLATAYVALVIKSEGPGPDLARALDLPSMSLADSTDPHTVVVLWPAEGDAVAGAVREALSRLREGAGRRFRAGLGGAHSGLRGISRSYLEAQQAVEVGRKLRPDAVLYQHDEVAPYLVLAQNPVVAERYVQHVLGRLVANDSRGTLLKTLEAVLTRGSIKDAAASLGLHRHTVLYRLERLQELVGGDLESPAMRQRLLLALDLRKLL
ncbi:MAG: helix-turn-helix domain-containing protein [Candidatus Dormibacteraeota bacterium]|nr:helix-turn-helix domain-containing protein [Candidatus Dormibacteraeota bacterium]MBO0705937.1 helix-turn-helix domain-containing protein [Candidatus Dormibacteraeota bacterium]MBO0759965.1 helix-turn-helix domain-containing protein [Candidatus Dormibacteraeota bacterium]